MVSQATIQIITLGYGIVSFGIVLYSLYLNKKQADVLRTLNKTNELLEKILNKIK